MDSGNIASLAEAPVRRRRRLEREAWEVERDRVRQEARERLARALGWDDTPPGGNGEVTGIQRIWLAHDGSGKADVAKPKRSLGQVKGGAIRLGEPDRSGVLTVCEGPEDGLSLLEMLGARVWVAAGASFLPAMQFPPEVRSIVIGADNDEAGEAKAQEAARAFAARGLPVRIIRPLDGFKDFNDELRGA